VFDVVEVGADVAVDSVGGVVEGIGVVVAPGPSSAQSEAVTIE
jgi:hypothetical protein